MNIPNPEKALETLQEFQRHLLENKRIFDINGGGRGDSGSRSARGHPTHKALQRLEPVVEDLARAIESDSSRHSPPSRLVYTSGMWSWSMHVSWTERLVGILENRSLRDELFTPAGPRLAASQLHWWVWNAAVALWDDGHYREAVQAAATAVEQETKRKVDRGDLSGGNLYLDVFMPGGKPGERRLRFVNIEEYTADGNTTQDWTSAHRGAAFFGQGCSQGIRNLVSHNTDDVDEQVALEHLAALSVLARWVDTAMVRTT